MGWEASWLSVRETLSRLIASNPRKIPMRGPKKPINWTKEKSCPVGVKSPKKRRVGFAIPFDSSWMPMPTMEAMITPTIKINAEMIRNRTLLKWSSNSFLNKVKIPCKLSLLEIFHIELFEGIMFFFHAQLFLGQFLNGPDRYQIPLDHDPHPITNPLDLIQAVGGEENGNIPIPAQGVDEVEHPVGSIRVQTNGRFIEEDELRLLDKDLCDPESLPHPFRIGPHLLLILFEEADLFEQLVNLFGRAPIGNMVQTGDEPEILPGIHIIIETNIFRQVSNLLFHAERFACRIESNDSDLPRARLRKA